ncbi:hypothetical protein BZL43_22210, partial [Pseudomonas sp. PICF141]
MMKWRTATSGRLPRYLCRAKIAISQERPDNAVRTFLRTKQNPYLQMQIGVSEFDLDDDLL